MKVGDVVHNAVWVTGDENDMMRLDYENRVKWSIDELCKEHGLVHGDFRITELDPETDLSKYIGDHPVPDHVQGSRVRLMVIEADIVDEVKEIEMGSFVHNLERGDLMKLRKITRDRYVKHFKRFPPEEEVDQIIEMLGPDAAVDALRDQTRH